MNTREAYFVLFQPDERERERERDRRQHGVKANTDGYANRHGI